MLPYLQRDYDEIDWLCSVGTIPLIEHNPRLNRVMRFPDNVIPLKHLHNYYEFCAEDYDKSFVLTQAVEGKFLPAYPQREYYYPIAKRRKKCNENYIESQIRGCGYEPEGNDTGELYFDATDIMRAKQLRHALKGKYIILWALVGSSIHKGYMHLESVMEMVFKAIPEAVLFLVGSFEDSFKFSWPHPKVINFGLEKFPVMSSFALAKYADLVIGPETALLNAAGCFDTPKICMLTHSSWKNLCATWKNDFSLQAQCWCSPCHILHKYTQIWQNMCTLDKHAFSMYGVPVPACTGEGFPKQFVFDRICEAYETTRKGHI